MADEKLIQFTDEEGDRIELRCAAEEGRPWPATESDLAAAGFVPASRLTAAEAMLEDARKLAEWAKDSVWRETVPYELACRILASRPSEQASKCVCALGGSGGHEEACPEYAVSCTRCGDKWLEDRKCPSSNYSLFCSRPEQASKEDSDATAAESYDRNKRYYEEREHYRAKARELETQIAEARAERQTFHDDYWARVRQCDELKAELEAAEALSGLLKDQLQHEQAERERLRTTLEAVRVIHPSTVAKVETAARPDPRDEEAPSPPTPPTRLGGPSDALRSEILAALQRVQARGVLAIGQQSMAFCEALVEELGKGA